MTSVTAKTPGIGSLVSVRGRRWVIGDVVPSLRNTVVILQSVENGRYGELAHDHLGGVAGP
ncbi:hypothetical protein ACQP2T_06400 [Nonomuraea sp. CA-143628]|uniref:hypothetical protein n=1 Tax=Nonomuraea sp. CA-143628 TaxID=3239997 RepID=UPI003D912A5B